MRKYRTHAAAAFGMMIAGVYAYFLNWVGFDGQGWLLLLLPGGAGVGALIASQLAPRLAVGAAILFLLIPAADGWVTVRAVGRATALRQEAEQAVRRQLPEAGIKVSAGTPANACNQVVVLTEQDGQFTWYWYDGNTATVNGRLTTERLVKHLQEAVPLANRLTLAAVQKLPDRVDFTYTTLKLNVRGIAGLTEGCQFRLAWVTVYPTTNREPFHYYPKVPLGE